MKYLLDTHVIIWWLNTPNKIKNSTQKIIKDKKNIIYISSVTIWEIAIKKQSNKIKIPSNFLEALKSEQFKLLDLIAEESLSVINLPSIHKDPFDRLLIAQAKLNDLTLITKDKKILKYPINTLVA